MKIKSCRLLAVCCAFLATVGLAVNEVTVRRLITGEEPATREPAATGGTTDLFDETVVHRARLTFSKRDFQRILKTYAKDESKDWMEANLHLDGKTFRRVGVRLKGNSSLASLTRDLDRTPAADGGSDAQPPSRSPNAEESTAAPSADPAPAGRGPVTMPRVKADEPESLPWLISFDHFVKGRRYQGHRALAVRTPGTGPAVGLNEALSLALLKRSGDPGPRFAYSSFAVNDRPGKARLLVEEPDTGLAGRLGRCGVLYKALSTGEFEYRGEDPAGYADDFKQVTRRGGRDIRPVIDLLRWVGDASDAEFSEEFGGRVDIEAFARYLTFHDLTLNFDDIGGPGKNYYLWYECEAHRFTVVSSDLDFAFIGDPSLGPRVGPEPAGGSALGSNLMKRRFLTLPAFRPTYEAAYRSGYQRLFASGAAGEALEALATTLLRSGVADPNAVNREAVALRAVIDDRTKSLAGNPVILSGR